MKHGLYVRCLTFCVCCMLIFLAKIISQHVSCNMFHLVALSSKAPSLDLIFNELTKRGGNRQYEVSNNGGTNKLLFNKIKKKSKHKIHFTILTWFHLVGWSESSDRCECCQDSLTRHHCVETRFQLSTSSNFCST